MGKSYHYFNKVSLKTQKVIFNFFFMDKAFS